MKDNLLKKFMRSTKFTRLSKPEQMIELHDFKYQKKDFKKRMYAGN
jgi:hypothetical protein